MHRCLIGGGESRKVQYSIIGRTSVVNAFVSRSAFLDINPLKINPIRWEALVVMLWMYSSNFRLLSYNKPRSLVEDAAGRM